MSGIIGSVGAKSGVIGSTEIPGGYEEGTFTGTNSNVSGYGFPHATYTKIGCMVFITCSVEVPNTTSNHGVEIMSLPFSPSTRALYYNFNIRAEALSFDLRATMHNGTAIVSFRKEDESGDRGVTVSDLKNNNFRVTGWYYTEA